MKHSGQGRFEGHGHNIIVLHLPHTCNLNFLTSDYVQYWHNTVKGFNFAVLKFRGFLDGDLSRWF